MSDLEDLNEAAAEAVRPRLLALTASPGWADALLSDRPFADLDAMLVSFPRLRDRLHTAAGYLSGGEQQMLAIARALMAKPSLLLLDEPSMGLAPIVVTEIFGIVRALNEQGLTIFLVEQNARQALGIAHHGYVMENGQIVLSGTGKELLVNPKIVEAYLGR